MSLDLGAFADTAAAVIALAALTSTLIVARSTINLQRHQVDMETYNQKTEVLLELSRTLIKMNAGGDDFRTEWGSMLFLVQRADQLVKVLPNARTTYDEHLLIANAFAKTVNNKKTVEHYKKAEDLTEPISIERTSVLSARAQFYCGQHQRDAGRKLFEKILMIQDDLASAGVPNMEGAITAILINWAESENLDGFREKRDSLMSRALEKINEIDSPVRRKPLIDYFDMKMRWFTEQDNPAPPKISSDEEIVDIQRRVLELLSRLDDADEST